MLWASDLRSGKALLRRRSRETRDPCLPRARPVFTRKYLANEVRAHRWIQMTLEESKRMESLEQVPTNRGYIYVNDNGIDMIEYHIDVSYHFEDKLAGCPFGGNLSTRKPIAAKLVIYVGQDEAIFKQFLFSHKMWVAPGGQ